MKDRLAIETIDPASSKISIWTDRMTIIPQEEYDESDIMRYLDVDEAETSLTMRSDFLGESSAYVCYAIAPSILAELSDHASESKIQHFITSLSRSLLRMYSSVILLYRQEDKTLLLAVKDGKILSFSTTQEVSPVSMLYHVSLVTEKHSRMKDATIALSGEFQEDDKTSRLMSKYFPTEVLGASFHLESIYQCAS